jgi:hypothetical protein
MNLSYCDYIAHIIKNNIISNDKENLLQNTKSTGPIGWDLHPEHGYMLSTKRTIMVIDRFGKAYRITIEEA